MSETNKIIEFNTEIFTKNKKTRKRKPIVSESLIKNRLFKSIRDKKNIEINDLPHNSEFESSLNFLNSLSKVKPETDDIKTEIPDSFILQEEPPYGCLKNGNKPTFKELNLTNQNKLPTFQIPINKTISFADKAPEKVAVADNNYVENTVKVVKNKKYTLGKSKLHKKIGVLINDKNTRKNNMNFEKNLKSVSLLEVKNQLKKKGLIKSGVQTSNNLLRAMYENSVMAGDIINTNKDTLIHNFTNL